MKVVHLLPRHSTFSRLAANSIDLCVRDLVRHSGFARTTFVLGPAIPHPFPDTDYHAVPPGRDGRSYDQGRLLEIVRTLGCDVIVVQQHVRTAVSVARAAGDIPVIVHRHSFEKDGHGRIKGYIVGRRYGALAGVIVVSEAVRRSLAARWPEVAPSVMTVHNGLDFAQWRPARVRRREILWVGRAVQEKGCVASAIGVVEALKRLPDWRARFILSNAHEQPAVFRQACAVLRDMEHRVDIEVDLPFEAVKAANEAAEIALCPSTWKEPFGRTALEAHAGGAALISSGTGGLREVSGAHALFLDDVTPGHIAQAVRRLAGSDDMRRRLQVDGRRAAQATFDMGIIGARYDDALSALACPSAPRRNAALAG